MYKQKKRWVLVADGARARIFSKSFHRLENAVDQDFIGNNLKDRELTTDKPGRCFESSNSARHAYEPRTDWHQHQKEVFAKELCDVLNRANENKEFEELLVIAPPKTLGDIRHHLDKQTTAKVTTEIPKDVTKFSEPELLSFLEKEF